MYLETVGDLNRLLDGLDLGDGNGLNKGDRGRLVILKALGQLRLAFPYYVAIMLERIDNVRSDQVSVRSAKQPIIV